MANDDRSSGQTAFLFDLDGTLVDSVYQHVLAWREALEAGGIQLAVWRIHRQIGMSGGLFVNALARETGRTLSTEEAERIHEVHTEAFKRYSSQVRPLPGAEELLNYLTEVGVPWAIATSGRIESARLSLRLLGIGEDVPIITRDLVTRNRIRIFSSQRLKNLVSRPVIQSWSAIAFGICSRRAAHGRSVSDCCQADMVEKSWSEPVRTGSITIRRIS
jgi:hypothetical protein